MTLEQGFNLPLVGKVYGQKGAPQVGGYIYKHSSQRRKEWIHKFIKIKRGYNVMYIKRISGKAKNKRRFFC